MRFFVFCAGEMAETMASGGDAVRKNTSFLLRVGVLAVYISSNGRFRFVLKRVRLS